MNEDINILILSCGTRNKIIQYFKKELYNQGKVIATDCSNLAPALYEADKYYIVPKMNEEGYKEKILSICKENNIKAVLSLIDPELSLLAKNKVAFKDIGTLPIVSDYNKVEMCFDKYKMYQYLVQNNFKTAKSYINKEAFYEDIEKRKIGFPVFVKPVKGSASNNISKVISKDEIEMLFNRFDNLMIQEYIDGKEYGVDVYVDLITGEISGLFIKEKLKMRAGETDKSVSVRDDKLFNLIQKFVDKVGFKGVLDIDVFKRNDEYYISEVNPRFGGGYPHAYECDINFPKMIIENVKGNKNEVFSDEYKEGIYMMKYNDINIQGEQV